MEDESPPRSTAVLDAPTLESLAEQLEEGFDSLLVRFRRRLEETPPTIRAAWAADERSAVTREAHSLKSVAATFGATTVSRTSAELESKAGGTRLEVDDLIGRLEGDCRAAGAAILAWSRDRGAASDDGSA